MKRILRFPLPLRLGLALATALAPVVVHATGDFYEEPLGSLPNFLKLDQLPAKTFQMILAETSPPEAEAEPVDLEKDIAALEGKPGKEALAQLDKLLVRARIAWNTDALKVLNDLRDLYAGPATAAETAEYVKWRLGAKTFTVEELDRLLAKASPALRPHYLYLRGAALFLDQRDADCQPTFEKILKEFPKHPRAEIALYMLARSQVSRSRSSEYMQHDRKLNADQRPRAKKLLDEYLAKYPKGRWAGDALGWLGAWYFDGNDFAAALRCYLGQLAMTDHPELAGSAATMVEMTLSHLASSPRDNKAWAEVAAHPQAAQALVYLLLNSAEADNYNGEYDSADEVRAWRKKLLPQIAAAIAAQEKLYKSETWRPRYLATLALAASGAGQQDQALKLLATAGAGAETDDLLLARGVTLQRAKRSKEAISVFRSLLEKFPKSPLAEGARLRVALALADNHEAGRAILELDQLLAKPEGAPDAPTVQEVVEDMGGYATYFEVPPAEVGQLIDLWLNFAPIEELAAPAQAADFDPVKRLRFTEAIAQRLLAKEQFDEAKKFMTPAQFGLVAGPIEKLTIAAREAKEPAARAAACLALADAWAAARGKLLTYPLDTDKTRHDVYGGDQASAQMRRAEAAVVFGYTGNFRLDLENRDELRHAFNWWIEASDQQPGTATTATALWRALRAMPLIADVSPYTYERALSRKWEDVSRKLYDRLRTECADSIEAKRLAVYWNFPGPKKPQPGEATVIEFRDAAGAKLRLFDVFGIETDDPADEDKRQALAAEIKQLVAAARSEKPEALKARMEKESAAARAKFTGLYNARWVNFYDDLALFFSEPDPGAEVRARYVELRASFLQKSAVGGGWGEEQQGNPDTELEKAIDTALADTATKPVADYFEFLKLAIIANQFTTVKAEHKENEQDKEKEKEAEFLDKDEGYEYRSRDYPLLAKQTKAFLEKYPKSEKREAALLLQARAVFRSSDEVVLAHFFTWPQGARWEGGYVTTVHSQESFDAKKVQDALEAYDAAFPQGRFAGDIRDCRAEVALRLRDWKTTLELTAAQISDPKRKELHEAAADRLGRTFGLLTDERYRSDLLPAIKANPKAKELFLKYLAYDNDAHPLRYMSAWLGEQMAKR